MNSYFAKELFVHLSKRAHELDLHPPAPRSSRKSVHNRTNSSSAKRNSSLSKKNTLRVSRYREKKNKDEVLKKLAKDIVQKKRHKRQLENAIASIDEKLETYDLTLDDFVKRLRQDSGHGRSPSKNSSSKESSLPSSVYETSSADDSAVDPADKERTDATSGGSSEIEVIRSRLQYLERKLELLKLSKGVDDDRYIQVKNHIDRISDMLRSKERQQMDS